MNIIDVIKSYRNVASFSDRAIEVDKIDRIVKSVNFSPVGTGTLPFKAIVVSKKSVKQKLRHAAEQVEKAYSHGTGNGEGTNNSDWKKPFLEEASCLIVICCTVGQPYQAATTWLTLGNVLMTASDEGLGVLCYAPSMPTFLKKVLNLPPKYMPIAIVPLGYPADELFPISDQKHEKMLRNLFSGRFRWQS
ncbi:MAG: nitroreductase family protein [candidate division Zixibacteria bacterium]|nr:nitroreductase family protein [candidate division Zixibacteria bacterium]